MPRFGAHMSIAGGLARAVARGVELHCQAIQIFVRNQRQWMAPVLTEAEAAAWRSALADADIRPALAHDNYLINLGSPRPDLWERSYAAFVDELDRCDRLGIDLMVTHPGSHLEAGREQGIERVVQALNRLGRERPDLRTSVLLETTAGQGTSLGWRFEELAAILGRLDRSDRFGVCLDTCHVFAAGYDIRSPEAVARTLDEFDRVIGLSRLHAIHINDSRRELASRVDRHEHIGRGRIGLDGLRAFVGQERLARLPMILETPKGVDPKTGREWDEINLARLRRLARGR